MALWGDNDNVTSAGKVWLNYGTGIVTATGTAFGAVGSAQTGNVIRFGVRGGGGTYFGDATISGITSATQLSIASTHGLTGAAIANQDFYISELPVYTVEDHAFSQKHDTVATYKTFATTTSNDFTPSGDAIVGVLFDGLGISTANSHGKDSLLHDSTNILVKSVGFGTVVSDSASSVGVKTVFVTPPPGVSQGNGSEIELTVGGTLGKHDLVSVAATSVSIASTISAAVAKGAVLTFHGPNIVALASTVAAGIATGDTLTFQRLMGGYDKNIYGISKEQSATYDGSSSKYRTSGAGWVGVTTYTDCHGHLRVKSEVLVAASGITTGANGILYPTNP
jgi:hypothetical protein